MAQFDIDSSHSNGQRLDWLALPDAAESPDDVLSKVKQAAIDKFGGIVFFNRWERIVASNGYITVRMYA